MEEAGPLPFRILPRTAQSQILNPHGLGGFFPLLRLSPLLEISKIKQHKCGAVACIISMSRLCRHAHWSDASLRKVTLGGDHLEAHKMENKRRLALIVLFIYVT